MKEYIFTCNDCGLIFVSKIKLSGLPLCPECSPKPASKAKEMKGGKK